MDEKEKAEACVGPRGTRPPAVITMAAFGDRIQGIWEIIDFLRNFDLGAVRDLVTAIQELLAAPDLKSRIRAALKVLEIGAGMTATTVDDEFVATLKKFATDEVIDILVRIIEVFSGFRTSEAVSLSADDRKVASAMGLPWPLLVQVALQLVKILERFFKD